MALIFSGSCCAICEEALVGRVYLATSGVFFEEDDPLFRFCDAPLHWDCYENWPERPRFALQHLKSQVQALAENPYWGLALLTDDFALTVRKNQPALARLWLVETGTEVEVLVADWSVWLWDLTVCEQELHRLEVLNVWRALPALRHRFPTPESVLSAVDWNAKERVEQAWAKKFARSRRAERKAIHAHNDACRRLFSRRDPQGLTCPHCLRQSTEIEFVDRSVDERKSFFVCRACGRSFGHAI